MPARHDRLNRLARITLIALNGFLATTALAGGLGLLSGWNAPPVAALAGSSFTSYLIPGLALLILVDGTALAATALLLLHHRRAALASRVTAGVITPLKPSRWRPWSFPSSGNRRARNPVTQALHREKAPHRPLGWDFAFRREFR